MSETLTPSLRRWFRFGTYRSDYVRLAVYAGPFYVVYRDTLYHESSEVPASHMAVGRLHIAWTHRG